VTNTSWLRALRRRLVVESLEDRTTPSALAAELGSVVVTATDAAALAASPLTASVRSLGFGTYQVNLAAGSVDSAVTTFAALPGVVTAEPDFVVGASIIPNDASFGSLWGMHNTGQSGGVVDADIDAPEAWDTARGTGTTAVGVIDSGIDYRHPDLYRNIWINQAEIPTTIRNVLTDTDADTLITFYDLNQSINIGPGKITDLNANGYIDGGDLLNNASGWEVGGDNGGNGYIDDLIGWDFVSNDNDPMDDNNHGTHCAGTIGAMGNNGVGVAGVAWRTRMAALKFLGASGSGAISGATAAVNYANSAGIRITSNSWGGGGFSQTMFNAINNHRANGGVFIAAAGNSTSNNDTTASYPSNYNVDNVVAVAATTRTDAISSFSSYGLTTVDLGAPGSSILSTTPNNTYSTFSGTSMATPHVSGVIAVVWDANPTFTYSQVIARILQTTRPITALSGRTVTGGVANLQAALGVSPPPPFNSGPRVTSSAFSGTSSANFNKVRFTFDEAVNTSSFTTADVVSLTGPGGAITPSGVTVVSSTQFDVTFATQTAGGTYTVVIGPAITDTAGNLMNQDNDLINGETTQDRYTGSMSLGTAQTFTNSTKYNILDNQTTSVPITVPVTGTIADIDVRVNITHTYDSDLYITLVSPTGSTIVLANRRGGSGDNFSNTTFSDEAATAIGSGAAPFAGTYRPEAVLSTYDGKSANGTWQVRVADQVSQDVGTVNSASLIITFAGGGSSIAVFGGAEPTEPVQALTRPAGRVGGDFVRAARTELPPLVTLTPAARPEITVTAPLPQFAETPAVAVVAGQPPRITDWVGEWMDEFAPIVV